MGDNNEMSIDNIPDLTPAYAILHFDLEALEGERRLRECLDAPNVLRAVRDFERWWRSAAETNSMKEKRETLETARDVLFACFADNDVTVPGWE